MSKLTFSPSLCDYRDYNTTHNVLLLRAFVYLSASGFLSVKDEYETSHIPSRRHARTKTDTNRMSGDCFERVPDRIHFHEPNTRASGVDVPVYSGVRQSLWPLVYMSHERLIFLCRVVLSLCRFVILSFAYRGSQDIARDGFRKHCCKV